MSKEAYGVDMNEEIYRDVPWATDYEASNYGSVRSKPKYVTNGRGMRLRKGKELKVSPNGQITLVVNGENNQVLKWKVIAQTFINGYKEGLRVEFKDGNKLNCSLDNFIIKWFNSIFSNVIQNTHQIIDGIPVIAGAFGEGKRVLFDISIATKIGVGVGELRASTIIPNLHRFMEGVHYIDLKNYSNFQEFIPILEEVGYTEKGIRDSNNIFIFSELGVSMLMSCLSNTNDAKWEFLDKFTRKYFQMEEQIKNQVPQISERDLALLAIINSKSDVDQALAIKHYEEVVTQPLIKTIEEQAPKVDKYDKLMESDGTYNATNSAKLLDIPTAQQFNKLLKDNKIQYKSGGNWVLTANYTWLIDEGYCKYIQGQNTNYSYIQLRWYPKGIEWLRDNILNVT